MFTINNPTILKFGHSDNQIARKNHKNLVILHCSKTVPTNRNQIKILKHPNDSCI